MPPEPKSMPLLAYQLAQLAGEYIYKIIIREFSCWYFFLLALQPPTGVVFYSPLAGFSLLAYEVS